MITFEGSLMDGLYQSICIVSFGSQVEIKKGCSDLLFVFADQTLGPWFH
jgi:hypothetical protein